LRISTPLAALATVLLLTTAARAEEEKGGPIEAGSRVSIEYTLTLDDGSTADSNVGQEPLVYTQGQDQILPALEEALAGLKAGDTKKVNLSPEQGYGEVRSDLEREVEASRIPEDGRHAGATLMSRGPQGQAMVVRVKEVKGDTVVLDLNHPLAGQNLHFDVKVVGVE
jgi:FKBP-type peptidyl-prolyl cis-trans isomerase SlyD